MNNCFFFVFFFKIIFLMQCLSHDSKATLYCFVSLSNTVNIYNFNYAFTYI